MNILTVPPSPNWYEERVLACAPDNTVIYSARNDIVILENNTNVEKPANVRIITRAHNQRVLTVSINKNWGQPKKLAVSTSEDKIVKIWDLETGKKVASHDKHLLDNKVVGATFAGDEKVISVSDDGNIVIWNITLNETTPLSNIFGMKVSITCISTCPHATWLTAFGLKSGLVIVTDLRKNGKVLYKMRGHDKEILSLAWCPVPINIFPKNPLNYVGLKKKETEPNEELKVEETALESIDSGGGDYLKECEHLKNKILAAKDNSTEVTHEEQEPTSEDQQLEKDVKDNDKVQEFEEIKSTGTALPSDSPSELSPATDKDGKKEEIPVPVSPLEPSTVKDEASKVEATPVSDPSLEAVSAEDKTINNDNVSVSDSTLLPNSTKDKESTPEVTNAALESSPAKEETIKTGDMSDVSSGSNKDKDEAGKTTDENNCTKTNKEAGRSIIKVVSQEEEPRKEFLLASSAKESHIYIWRAGTDGRMQTFLTVPHKTKNKQKTFIDKIWISLCWITPKILLSSSKQNELLAWHLPKDQDHEKNMTVVHKDHSSLLFSIAAPMQLFDEYNWNEPAKFMNAWTTSQDRLLLNTNITKDRKSLACYPTLGGQVNCLQLSPLDPNRLAIGTTDCFIKSWDLSRPNIQSIYMRTFFNKVLSKVTALAWHPTNELILAFGTTEGRIGYLDPSNKAKATVIFRNHFRSQIYKLEWGPVKGNKEQLGLYAISDGRIVIFDPSQPTQEPSEFNGPSGVFLYSLAWMPDYSMLVVVTKEGYIIAYTPRLKTICKHYLQHRLQEITWHPNASDKTSTYHNWFAAISNFKNVVVYKFDIESGNNDENLMCLYQSESDLLHCVTWNPHEPSQLVIGCESGIAHILDAEKNQMIATYVNPNYEGIVSAVWSPLDPDFIICGSKDNTLRVWKVSENPPITEESVLIKERKKYIKENLLVNNHSPPQKVQQSTEEGVKSKKVVKNGLLPTFYAPKNVHQIICGLKKLLAWTEQSEDVETDTVDFTKNDILNIFGSDAAMQNLVSLNEISHKKKGKYDFNITLSLFRGDISTTIKEAIEEKRVTPWIISLAPMVSPKLWQSACETYADQLNEKPDSDPMETATYYLACHKVQNAVDCLCEAAMFKEALALAKCRMLGKDVASRIIEKWAEQAKFDGNFEVAAQCYIYLGKCEEAAFLLFRRTDLETLEFVVQLSEKIGNEDLLNAAVTRYNAFKANEEPGKTQELPTRQEVVLQQNGHSPNSISSIEQANSSSEICNKSEESIEGKDTSAASNETDTDAAQAVVSINCSNVTTVQAGSCVKDIEGEDANKSSSDSIDTVKNAKDSAMQNNQSDDVLLKTIENEKHQDEDAGESLISEDGVKNEKTATKDESRENNSVIVTEET